MFWFLLLHDYVHHLRSFCSFLSAREQLQIFFLVPITQFPRKVIFLVLAEKPTKKFLQENCFLKKCSDNATKYNYAEKPVVY